LGWLDVKTVFARDKITRQRRGHALGHRVTGYQIHHGRTEAGDGWIALDDVYGAVGDGMWNGRFVGTTLHGLLEADGFRAAFLRRVAAARGKQWAPAGASFRTAREQQWDRVADAIQAYVDMDALERLIGTAA
jgi:adenosylcobyric acid synthase